MAVLSGVRTVDKVLNELLEEKRSLAESVFSLAEVSAAERERRFAELLSVA